MSLWIERKYISLLSGRLRNFKAKSGSLYNASCPICQDSVKNKRKARLYFYEREQHFFVFCHNCGLSTTLAKFLQQFDSAMAEDMATEAFNERFNKVEPLKPKSIVPSEYKSMLSSLKTLADLPRRHKARKYVESRKIPDKWYKQLYYCQDFKIWTNQQIPNKFADTTLDEDRIVIPFIDPTGNYYGYQGRAIDENPIRYISILLDETKPRIWNWGGVDFNYRFYILEGPIDAMFVENAIATAGGKILAEVKKLGCGLDNGVFVFDCEPRNEAILTQMRQIIKHDLAIVIWEPDHPYKDINEMVVAGYKTDFIMELLKKQTFRGLEAELEFAKFSKV